MNMAHGSNSNFIQISPQIWGLSSTRVCIYEQLNNISSASRGREILPKMKTLSKWTFTIQLQFTRQIYKLDLKVRMCLQGTQNQPSIAGKLLNRSTTCIWNRVITICEKKLLLRIDQNSTVISALNLCFYHVLQLDSVLCAAKQVPL